MIRRFVSLALFLVGAPAIGALALVATSEAWLDPWMRLGFVAAAWLFLLATTLLAGLSLVPTHAASLVAGMLFGALTGSLMALLGIALAALLSFLVLRRLVGERALAELLHRPRAAAVHRALLRRGPRRSMSLIALVRFSPVMPFAGTNLLLASSGVGLREFLLGSVVGLAPRVVAVAVAGAGLAQLDLSRGADLRLAVLGAVATVALLVVLWAVGRRALREVTA